MYTHDSLRGVSEVTVGAADLDLDHLCGDGRKGGQAEGESCGGEHRDGDCQSTGTRGMCEEGNEGRLAQPVKEREREGEEKEGPKRARRWRGTEERAGYLRAGEGRFAMPGGTVCWDAGPTIDKARSDVDMRLSRNSSGTAPHWRTKTTPVEHAAVLPGICFRCWGLSLPTTISSRCQRAC